MMMFSEYKDVVSIDDISEMLNIGKSSVYNLLQGNQIRHVKVGKKYIVPKQSVIDFVSGFCYNNLAISSRLIQQSPKGA